MCVCLCGWGGRGWGGGGDGVSMLILPLILTKKRNIQTNKASCFTRTPCKKSNHSGKCSNGFGT